MAPLCFATILLPHAPVEQTAVLVLEVYLIEWGG